MSGLRLDEAHHCGDTSSYYSRFDCREHLGWHADKATNSSHRQVQKTQVHEVNNQHITHVEDFLNACSMSSRILQTYITE